jgi:hypothetical protein
MVDVFEEKTKLIAEYKEDNDKRYSQYLADLKRFEPLEQKAYREWLKNLSPDEMSLKDRIYDLNENLFGDLTFEEPLEEDQPGDRIMQPFEEDPLCMTRYIINPDIKVMGEYDPMANTISFHPDHLLDEHIVHEMLHVYDYYYDRNSLLKDFWVTRLYSRLQSKVKRLDGYCCQLGLMRGQLIDEIWGTHSIFFLLKTLDLDIRLDLPFGRVFGYSKVLSFCNSENE